MCPPLRGSTQKQAPQAHRPVQAHHAQGRVPLSLAQHGAGFPPRAEQGSLSEILRVKIGAGFGVPGVREGYLTTKLGRDLSWLALRCRSATHNVGVPMRGWARQKGGGLGLYDFAAAERQDTSCRGPECAELDAGADLRYRLTVHTLSKVSRGEGGQACAEAGACAGVRGCAGASSICNRGGSEKKPPDISVKVEICCLESLPVC